MADEEKQDRPGDLAEPAAAETPQDPGVPGVKLPADEPAQGAEAGLQRDPDEWVTGDEPMTPAQSSYLRTLCERANEPFDETLTKAQASKRIDELRAKTGLG